ncbi:MAG: short chain dehydrogenase [Betaproteobacteria bacterium]|nr:short chain dehydrogenase [Betaproteobacteria bacterium]
MDLKLTGQTALVTGASRGIGLAVAHELAREGCNLHLASRTAADLEAAKASIAKEFKVKIECHALDLGESRNIATLVQRAGDVDILVNNAGVTPSGELLKIDETQWRQGWELKLFGYINLTREIYGRMRARKNGVIINVIGVAGERPRQDYIAGSTGNAALMAFTRTLGGDSMDYGVRVVGINPGQIETDRLRTRLQKKAEIAFKDASRWKELLKNPMGQPQEIADLVAYLASPRASFISGTIVTADAGRAARHID